MTQRASATVAEKRETRLPRHGGMLKGLELTSRSVTRRRRSRSSPPAASQCAGEAGGAPPSPSCCTGGTGAGLQRLHAMRKEWEEHLPVRRRALKRRERCRQRPRGAPTEPSKHLQECRDALRSQKEHPGPFPSTRESHRPHFQASWRLRAVKSTATESTSVNR